MVGCTLQDASHHFIHWSWSNIDEMVGLHLHDISILLMRFNFVQEMVGYPQRYPKQSTIILKMSHFAGLYTI